MKSCSVIPITLALLSLSTIRLQAQFTSATLTGVVSDTSGAVVPQAKVKLVNEQSGDIRETTTNNDGYYTLSGLGVGGFTFKLTVEAKGFVTYDAPGISLLGGEKRNVNVTLTVGNTSQTVEVLGVANAVVPEDSGEKSETLTTKELENYVQVGSNAAEFIKIMPGFGIQNGSSNHSNYTGEIIGINANGGSGSQSPLNNAFSYNGLPSNSLDITADGAHVSDPGCNCDTPVNPNSDMVSEFKLMSSNFSAENQKGPMVISSIAKSGGSQFHGSAFFYARNYDLNSNDWLYNFSGQSRPQNKYYYPGGTFGGPVLIPGTSFNKNRNKLFFFTGFEYFYQVLDTGLLRATVPTTSLEGGNFSPASILAAEGPIVGSTGSPPGQLNAAALAVFPGGQIPSSAIDPNMIAMMKLYPAANANPATDGGYNYVKSEIFNQNNKQWMTRVDYSISDNTKLFVRYNLQRELQQFPVGLWWTQTNQVPYPTPILGENKSDSVSASLTHVFSPTMTNEFVFGYTFIGFPNVFSNPADVNRANVGYGYTGYYKNGVAQIPSFGGTGGAGDAALIFTPGGFEDGGTSQGLYADKYMPSLSDTVTKVVGTHTIKGGFFWEWIRNAQPANDDTNGYLQFYSAGNTSFGNAYADEVTGNLYNYTESSKNRVNDIAYNTIEPWLQDDWKVTRRLTVNFGMRFTHFQPWYDREGFGYSIFNPAAYSATSPSCTLLSYCGFEWHSQNPSVPLAGFPTRAFFYQPRFGVAYDLTGHGKTVFRGGWGRYYFHAGQFTSGLDVSAGVQTVTITPSSCGSLAHLYANTLDTLSCPQQAGSAAAVDSTDSNQAHTDSYNLTISQQTPWSGLLEVAYVGNQTHNIPSSGNGGSAGFGTLNINLVPLGAMLAQNNGGQNPNNLNSALFRPYSLYGDLDVSTNNAYANYNAFQLTWVRSKGRYTLNLNYTYGKAMGIVGFFDQFNLNNNYGVLPTNRTQVFNIAYSIELGDPTHDRLLGGVINGWQLSGITQWQSGPNLSGFQSENFGMTVNGADIPGTNFLISNVSILGTPDMQLNPILTCNPPANLATHQYINGSCFALPTQVGQNGPTIVPPIYGPAFFDTDLGIFKNFHIRESKNLQIRANAYNFLNHPLYSFNGTNLSLNYNSAGQMSSPLFGYADTKQGSRIVQLAVKFMF